MMLQQVMSTKHQHREHKEALRFLALPQPACCLYRNELKTVTWRVVGVAPGPVLQAVSKLTAETTA
jgi:hypothetical protein